MELEDACCLHLHLWQSVLNIIVVRSEQGGKSSLLLLESLLLCAELFEGWSLHFYLGGSFRQFCSHVWSILKLHEYCFKWLCVVFRGELKWFMKLYFIFSNQHSVISGTM